MPFIVMVEQQARTMKLMKFMKTSKLNGYRLYCFLVLFAVDLSEGSYDSTIRSPSSCPSWFKLFLYLQ